MSMTAKILIGYMIGIDVGLIICLFAWLIYLVISTDVLYQMYDLIKTVFKKSKKTTCDDNMCISEEMELLAKNLRELSNYGVTYEEACINILKNIKRSN